jgi:hypothetical protein
MDDLKSEVMAVSKIISKDFQLDEAKSLIPASDLATLEEFKEYLKEKLADLLENKYDVLINILYRIDVNESKLSELFSGKSRGNIPEKLAELIIERQLQKLRFRQQYKNDKF